MKEAILQILREWNKRYGERTQLQHAYIAVSLAAVVVGGLVSLFQTGLGRAIAKIGLGGLVIAGINLLFWGLVYGLVITQISTRGNRRR